MHISSDDLTHQHINFSNFISTQDSKFLYQCEQIDRVFNETFQKTKENSSEQQILIKNKQAWDHFVLSARKQATNSLLEKTYHPDEPGINVVVMRGGEVLYQRSIGLADQQTGSAHSLQQRQHFGSNSKQFTAFSVLNLVKENPEKFPEGLDTEVHVLLPELPKFYHEGKPVKVTINHLLRMHSGLPNTLELADFLGIEEKDLTENTAIEILNQFSKNQILELEVAPESKFDYNNANYWLLASIVKKVSGKDLRVYADEKIFGDNAVGMKNTHFVDPDQSIEEQTVPAYRLKEGQFEPLKTLNKTSGPCGVIGTAEDMVKWDEALSKKEKLDPEIVDAFLSTPPKLSPERPYGNGINVYDIGNYRIYAHWGGIGEYVTRYVRAEHRSNPEKAFSLFVNSNSSRSKGPPIAFENIVNEITNTFAGETIFEKTGLEGIAQMKEDSEISESKVYLPDTCLGNYRGTQFSKCTCRIERDDMGRYFFYLNNSPGPAPITMQKDLSSPIVGLPRGEILEFTEAGNIMTFHLSPKYSVQFKKEGV